MVSVLCVTIAAGCFRSHLHGEGGDDGARRDGAVRDASMHDAARVDGSRDSSTSDGSLRDSSRDGGTIERTTFCTDLAFLLCRPWEDCGCQLPPRIEVGCAAFVSVECREHFFTLDMSEAIERGDIRVDLDALARVHADLRDRASRCEPPFEEWTAREFSTFRGTFVGGLPEGADCSVPSRRVTFWGDADREQLLPNDCASGDCRSICVPWSADAVTPVDSWCNHPDYRPYADYFGAPDELRWVVIDGMCRRGLAAGESCVGFRQCESRNCEDGVCQRPRENGSVCDHADDECASRFCSTSERPGICRPGDAPLATRIERTVGECESNVSIDGTCAPRICWHLTWSYERPWRH